MVVFLERVYSDGPSVLADWWHLNYKRPMREIPGVDIGFLAPKLWAGRIISKSSCNRITSKKNLSVRKLARNLQVGLLYYTQKMEQAGCVR